MPLNRPALTLGPGPEGVQAARRWVVETCTAIGREDLIECAEVGVSELVTNALLHAQPPLSVRVRGTRQHPRIEVRDGSTVPPALPEPESLEDHDELLLTFGRGLSIVSRAADAWGVEIEEEGKFVWFAPAAAFAEEMSVEGRITGITEPPPAEEEDDDDLVGVSIRGIPVTTYLESSRHFAELRREIRLLALAHQDDYPMAKSLSDLFSSFDRPSRSRVSTEQMERALAEGHDAVDLDLRLPADMIGRVGDFMKMLDLADEFCRAERLLALARTPEQRDFQNWFLGEIVRQSRGREPRPWQSDSDGVRENSLS